MNTITNPILASFTDFDVYHDHEFSREFETMQYLEDYCDFHDYLALTSLTVNGILYNTVEEYWHVQAQWDDAQ